MRYYNKPINETLKYLKVNQESGLNTSDVDSRRKNTDLMNFKLKKENLF